MVNYSSHFKVELCIMTSPWRASYLVFNNIFMHDPYYLYFVSKNIVELKQ